MGKKWRTETITKKAEDELVNAVHERHWILVKMMEIWSDGCTMFSKKPPKKQ